MDGNQQTYQESRRTDVVCAHRFNRDYWLRQLAGHGGNTMMSVSYGLAMCPRRRKLAVPSSNLVEF